MGFIINNEQQRQRISISPEAMVVLEHDISDFNLDGLGALINAILVYLEKHNVSQDAVLNQYREQTYLYLKNAGIDSDIDVILEKLCEYKKNDIMQKISSHKTHKRGNIGKNIYIKQHVLRWLESPDNTEDVYYGGSLLLYLNCVIEDYVKKDLYTRETIIIDSLIAKINGYIKDEEWVNIYWPSNRSVRIFPVKILPDKMSTHAYLACYMLSEDGKCTPSSYRLTSLPNDMQVAYGYNPNITKSDIKTLDSLISERRVDFLSYNAVDIKVHLTKHGLQRYIRTARLRPDIVSSEKQSDESMICIFHCTEQQAEYYFTSFGSDIEILSPKSLREKFTKIYQEALNTYLP